MTIEEVQVSRSGEERLTRDIEEEAARNGYCREDLIETYLLVLARPKK
jgi:hypothetical protein